MSQFPFDLVTPTDAELHEEQMEQALEERDARIAYLRQRVAELERERDAAQSLLADAETDMRALSQHVVKLRDEREAEIETRMWVARQIDVLRIAAERVVSASRAHAVALNLNTDAIKTNDATAAANSWRAVDAADNARLMAASCLVQAVFALSHGTRSQMARGDVDDAEGAAAEALRSMSAAANGDGE